MWFEVPTTTANIKNIIIALLVEKKLPVLLIGKNSKNSIKKKGNPTYFIDELKL